MFTPRRLVHWSWPNRDAGLRFVRTGRAFGGFAIGLLVLRCPAVDDCLGQQFSLSSSAGIVDVEAGLHGKKPKVDTSLTHTQLTRRTALKAGAATAGLLGLGLATSAPAVASVGTQQSSLTSAQAGSQQSGWRWCNRCQCTFYSQNYTTGWCPKGGGHNYRGSGNYNPWYDSGSGQGSWQSDWCWCYKCEILWYGGSHSLGHCPSGGGHSKRGSGNYYLCYDNPPADEQDGWRWCNKCYCMCYGKIEGYCPVGNHRHNYNGSGGYFMSYE